MCNKVQSRLRFCANGAILKSLAHFETSAENPMHWHFSDSVVHRYYLFFSSIVFSESVLEDAFTGIEI